MNWLGLGTADWVILAVYLLGITVLGVWSYRRVHNTDDYFMGGRRFGKVFMMFFAFGAGTSSEQAVTVAAGAFRNGLAGIWYQFLWLWATPFYWIIAPVFRRMRALTTSDFFEARYDSSTATLYSILGIIMSVVFIGAALFGSGEMIEGLTGGGLKSSYAIAAMTIMFVTYGMAGGLGAAIITDLVQGVLTIIFSFLLLPFALDMAATVIGASGGFAALHTNVPDRPDMLELFLSSEAAEVLAKTMGKEPITNFYILMLSITGLLGIVVQPHIMGVCAAGKTEFEGRFGFTFGNFIKRFCTIAWTFTGLACIIIYLTPDRIEAFNGAGEQAVQVAIAQAEERGDPAPAPDELDLIRNEAKNKAESSFANRVFGLAAHDILPTIAPGLVGLLLASLLAAIMSTCDAQMVVSSGLFTENIYRRFINPSATPKHYLWVGRISGLVIVGMALLMQTQFHDVIQVLTTYVQALPAFMGFAFWFGITWRGYTPWGVWASTFATASTWFLTQTHTPLKIIAGFGPSEFFQRNLDYFPGLFRNGLHDVFPFMMIERGDSYRTSVPWQMLLYASAGVIAGLAVSLMTRRTPKEKLDHFFTLLRTPIRPGEHVAVPCTLPEDPLPAETGKLIPLADLEIPRPTLLGMGGFAASWVMVGVVILLTMWLAGLGG